MRIVQDIDLGQGHIFVRGGKGNKDRTTFLLKHLRGAMEAQIEEVRAVHAGDLADGYGAVWLRDSFATHVMNTDIDRLVGPLDRLYSPKFV